MGNLMSPDEVAALLGVPKATLQQWRTTGRQGLPYLKLGLHVRYQRSDVEKLIQRNLVRSTTEGRERKAVLTDEIKRGWST